MPQLFIDAFHRRLNHLITEKIDAAMVHLAHGAAGDFAEYKHRCGYIQACLDVIEWCKEVERTEYNIQPETPEAAE